MTEQKKASELDPYIEDISKVLSHSGTRIKAAKWHFKKEKGIKCTYDNFKIL